MNRLVLQRNVQFLYEEQLARMEARALGCDGWDRDGDNPWEVDVRADGCAAEVLSRSAYAGTLDGRPTVYAELIRPRYQGGEFNRTRSVNQYLTHWIYPYQGKFHPQMARALLNIAGRARGVAGAGPVPGQRHDRAGGRAVGDALHRHRHVAAVRAAYSREDRLGGGRRSHPRPGRGPARRDGAGPGKRRRRRPRQSARRGLRPDRPHGGPERRIAAAARRPGGVPEEPQGHAAVRRGPLRGP